MVSAEEQAFEAIGFIGGSVLALSLIPQIVKTHKLRTARDISFGWQGVYITGLSLIIVYAAHGRIYPVMIPASFEWCCLVYLTILKIVFDRRENAMAKKDPPLPFEMHSTTSNPPIPNAGDGSTPRARSRTSSNNGKAYIPVNLEVPQTEP
eukprot:TRINITY_DN9552_c0_g1::TRINITY_DN9552_c0_g1_i1::g.12276::m.12276 TRINITY_DN9552_c0_g1::TRINITY_DN9552_c0_g1_i1::g.12276  ORF type:complete len:151 (+),score=6.66,PQ-loop/PF04193.9/3.4e-06 TRINITY_DN9552_c0_g1_i1:62-514(+)